MPAYYRLGELPHTPHSPFYKPDGSLYVEELFGRADLPGRYSMLYYHQALKHMRQATPYPPLQPLYQAWHEETSRHHHLKGARLAPVGDAVMGRHVLLYNTDLIVSIVKPLLPMDYFYRDMDSDLLYFIHSGCGMLETNFGLLPFHEGDYIVLPRGTTFRFLLAPQRAPILFLLIEGHGSIESPDCFQNQNGQMLDHAPYNEQNIRRPEELIYEAEPGNFEVRVCSGGLITCYWYEMHPCNVVGWDGYEYPWIFNIADFEPVPGHLQQPFVYQTFQGSNFQLRSFVGRGPQQELLLPTSYQNAECDELVYYVNGNFGRRCGIERASITLHPRGVPQVVQHNMIEEIAVHLYVQEPLQLTTSAQSVDDPTYLSS